MQNPHAALAAVHHQHLAHGLAVRALRDADTPQFEALRLGITLNLTNAVPNDPGDPVDLEAARRIDALANRIFLEPILRGSYPADLLKDGFSLWLAELVRETDLAVIATPIDFLDVNHFRDDNVSGHPLPAGAEPGLAPTDRPATSPFVGSEYVTFPTRHLPQTAMGWEVNPAGLRSLLVRLGQEYDNLRPLYVTENGAAYDDRVSNDGHVHDVQRTAYMIDTTPVRSGLRSQTGQASGLFRVVPARQLRVGLGLQQALRHRPSRLREPGPHHQGQRPRIRPHHGLSEASDPDPAARC